MTLVPDASVVVALLADRGPDGAWATARLWQRPLVAPALVPAEVTSSLRRLERLRASPRHLVQSALSRLLRLPVELVPFAPYAVRIWSLRHNLTPYDAWYVALAESLDCPLLTLDRRLQRAPGVQCRIESPTEH